MSMYAKPKVSLKDARKQIGGRASAEARRVRNGSNGSAIIVRKRSRGLSAGNYDQRRKLMKLYQLACMQIEPVKIAEVMNESPSWVSKNLKRIAEDFASLFQSSEARNLIEQNIAKFDMMIGEAMKVLTTTKEGDARRIGAIQTVADLMKKKTDYEVTVGLVRKAPDDVRVAGLIGVTAHSPAIEALREEFEGGDLDTILEEVAASIAAKRNEKVIEGEIVPVN